MKFRQILDQTTEAVPAYRRLIFSTIVAGRLLVALDDTTYGKTGRRRKRERRDRWQNTKCGIAAALVNGIRQLFHLPVLVVCDSWFGNHALLKALRETDGLPDVNILSRLRVSCVLITQDRAPRRRHPKPNSAAFAFADIRRQLAAELGKAPHFQWGCPETVKRAAKLMRSAIFGRAA